MVYVVMAYIVMAYIVLVCVVMAYIAMGYTVMAYTAMAYIVMAYIMMGIPRLISIPGHFFPRRWRCGSGLGWANRNAITVWAITIRPKVHGP